MSDLRDLYQQTILDHTKRPRNFHEVPDANHRANGHNPLCGDKLTVYLKIQNDIIQDAGFVGAGCAISTASASMMTEMIKGKKVADIAPLFENFHSMVTAPIGVEPDEQRLESLDKLAVFSGVREFPVRVKCATLAWHTLQAALKDARGPVSTE